MRRAARQDANHKEIVKALVGAGAVVCDLSGVGNGCPDILVGFSGRTFLLEIKDGSKLPSQRKLTEDQVIWHNRWTGGTLRIVESIEAALAVIHGNNTTDTVESTTGISRD